MGFRTNSYGKIWSVESKGNYSVVEMSISKKNTQSGEYETDFSSKFVRFIGAAHKEASSLSKGDSIKLGDVEVTNKYDKEKNTTYTNFMVYSFEISESKKAGTKSSNGKTSNTTSGNSSKATCKPTTKKEPEMMNIPDGIEEFLPFN